MINRYATYIQLNYIYIKLKKSHSQENLFHNKGYKMILCTITICFKKNMHRKDTGRIQNKMLTAAICSW